MTDDLTNVIKYYSDKVRRHGAIPAGMDWKDETTVALRYDQLLGLIRKKSNFSLLDYGCGYGALAPYMENIGYFDFDYFGYDISEEMIKAAKAHNSGTRRTFLDGDSADFPIFDYAIASGVFNVKLDADLKDWQNHVKTTITQIFSICRYGLAVNFLTSYSDADRMRDYLYYSNPEEMFGFAKGLTRNVALLHDYELYDFTLILRHEGSTAIAQHV